ncbi:uncharacterized protein LOC127505468 isoform X9 [Ctenopharyngodon idella]|uniref:uncharacterized protein LOC127505468 isoform X9 n=1 Tax=Ctenopharyngodon idella TaxID=7959 RepID=UPI002232CB73|nr:uncharacterized protein LOC127505468 isoform X9 [Ctenopharyngodon idella]
MKRVMAVLQTSDVMCLCVFLLCAGLHFATGCKEASGIISCSPGESVLLHCKDKNSQRKDIQWWRSDIEDSQKHLVDVIKDQRYKHRAHIHKNRSLSITRLTVDDTGSYWCNSADPVHLLIEGCSISGNEASESISRYSGESVFLPCLVKCSARHDPDKVRWKLPNNREINQTTKSTELNGLYQGRFHMFDTNSGNFSLLISNLTEKDEGLYSCRINENQHKSFNLTVKDPLKSSEISPLKYPLMFLICLMLLVLTGFICWRYAQAKKGRRGSRVTPRPDHQDDVTYSTVMQINSGKPAENQQQDDVTYSSVKHIKRGKRTRRKEEEVVYSTMADVSNGRSAQDDVTYTSVVCSKSHKPRSLQMNTEATVYASVQKDKT